jgi:hypothetical protein
MPFAALPASRDPTALSLSVLRTRHAANRVFAIWRLDVLNFNICLLIWLHQVFGADGTLNAATSQIPDPLVATLLDTSCKYNDDMKF